jgi:hypothetical protein
LLTVTAPLLWLLLNEKIVPFDKVVASGNLITCPPEPLIRITGADATVRLTCVPDAVMVERLLKNAFAVIFWLASRKTTEFAPLEVVTPVPPLATFNVPLKVIAPVVEVEGLNPVVPALKDETVAGNDAQEGTPELKTRYCPFVPAAKNDVAPELV